MIDTIHKYADDKDRLAETRLRELLNYNVLTQEQVFGLFEVAVKLQAKATLYNIPLVQASAVHNLKYARDIVDYMENTPGVTPNSETYRLLITAHAHSPNYKEAGEVLAKLRSFDAAEVEHYTALIELYGGEGEVGKCVEVYSEFSKTNLKPDAAIMGAMVEAFVSSNQIEQALMVVAKMRDENLKIPIRVFNAVLKLCVGSSKKTNLVLQFMKSVNAPPSSETFATVHDDVDYLTFLSLWAQVTKNQYPIPVESMQLTLARCAKEVDLARIKDLAQDVLKLAYGLRATTPLINSVLKALVMAKETPEKVWSMYEKLIAIIDEPDKETFEVLICYFAIGDYARAMKLYDSMQKQQLAITDPVFDALLLNTPRTHAGKQNPLVAQLVRAGAERKLTPSRAALEHVVPMVSHDVMPQFTQLIARRKAIEDVEEEAYQVAEQKRVQEETKKNEEEHKKKDEEQKRKEQKRQEEELKRQEEIRKRQEQQARQEERNRQIAEKKKALEEAATKKKQAAEAKKQQAVESPADAKKRGRSKNT